MGDAGHEAQDRCISSVTPEEDLEEIDEQEDQMREIEDSARPSADTVRKWREMMSGEGGIKAYMLAHSKKFRSRVRRGIPQEFRWEVWKAMTRLSEHSDLLEAYARLKSIESKWNPLISVDIPRTFPEKPDCDAEWQESLRRILNAYANHNTEVGYCQGMNFVAGLLLLVAENEAETFGMFCCLMDNGLSGFYKEKMPLLRLYLKATGRLLAEKLPHIRDHFIDQNVPPAVFLHNWFLTLFINTFPLSTVLVVWDVIVCDGLPVILAITVAILQVMQDSLIAMDFENIIMFFKTMKTYDDDGEMNARRIGKFLMKQTESMELPDHILEFVLQEPVDAMLNGSDDWEQEPHHERFLREMGQGIASVAGLLGPGQDRNNPHKRGRPLPRWLQNGDSKPTTSNRD